MRILCLVLALAAISGCTLFSGYSGECSVVTVINNTRGVNLDILADGQVVSKDLKPGEHFNVPITFNRYTNISIIGRDSSGAMVGAVSNDFWGGERREYNYNYSGYYGGSGAISQPWIVNTGDLRKRE